MNTVLKSPKTALKSAEMEYRAYPADLEMRNNYLQEMESIIEKAKSEKRSISIAESNRFTELKSKVAEIDNSREQRELNNLTDNSITSKAGKTPLTPQEKQEIRAFVDYVRTGHYEGRDLSSGQSGSVIPKTVASMVIQKVKELAPIFERMTHYQVTGNLSLPSYPWDAHTTAFYEDFSPISSSGGTFITVDLEAHCCASLALIGRNLITRTDIPVIDIIVQQIAMSIANFLNNEIINNSSATLSGTLQSVTQTIPAAGATGVTIDDLISLQMKVPSVFQNNSAFLLHPDTFLAIRSLKDNNANPLMLSGNQSLANDLGFQLLGKPVLLDENMPGIGAAGRSVYYGDFAGLVCNQNAELRTQILIERYVDINATGVITTWDLDISLAQPRALAALVHPAV